MNATQFVKSIFVNDSYVFAIQKDNNSLNKLTVYSIDKS